MDRDLNQGFAYILCKGQLINISFVCGPYWGYGKYSIFCFSVKATINNIQENELGCVPIKLYLWTLNFKSHIIFPCHKILFHLFQPFKNAACI